MRRANTSAAGPFLHDPFLPLRIVVFSRRSAYHCLHPRACRHADGTGADRGCDPGDDRTAEVRMAANHELADYCRMDKTMLTEKEIADARATLNELQVEHRDLNLIVEHLAATPLPDQDQLLIQRLKKRKLGLKDKIYQLEKMLVPDIQA